MIAMPAFNLRRTVEGLVVPLLLVAVWQAVCSAGLVNPLVLPAPAAVAHKWVLYLLPLEAYDPATQSRLAWIFSGEMPHDILGSMTRVVLGFVVGAGLA